MTTKTLGATGLCAFVFAIPLGGFFFGFTHAEGAGGNILGHIFIGIVLMVITPLSLGFPPQNEGGVGEPHNAWPYIFAAFVLLFTLMIMRVNRRSPSKL
jgi:hypothetical protein